MPPPTTTIVPSEAHPETMDFLSRAWCDFAVQTFHPPEDNTSLLALDNKPAANFDRDLAISPAFLSMDRKGMNMDDPDLKSLPPWKSNDLKSWIWMQQAMHPELNYNRKKWVPWKAGPFKITSIKKWLKEMKQRRKEEGRLARAEVHAAISMAGLAAALAAVAAADNKSKQNTITKSTTPRDDSVASAAALVAAHCAKMAESMGAKKEQLRSVISSAMSSSDIHTLTAAATTSLKGAATLKARTECKSRLMNGSAPILPIEDSHEVVDLDFDKNRSMLSSGTELHVETPDGDFRVRWVSIMQDRQGRVVLRMRKMNLFKTKTESIVRDIHAELYKDPYDEATEETDTCYLVVLSTNRGMIKLDMGDDYDRYKAWAATITRMLAPSTSLSNYELPFFKN